MIYVSLTEVELPEAERWCDKHQEAHRIRLQPYAIDDDGFRPLPVIDACNVGVDDGST